MRRAAIHDERSFPVTLDQNRTAGFLALEHGFEAGWDADALLLERQLKLAVNKVKSVVDRLSPTMQEERIGCECLPRVMASRVRARLR